MCIPSYGLLALLGTVADWQGTAMKSPCFARAEYFSVSRMGKQVSPGRGLSRRPSLPEQGHQRQARDHTCSVQVQLPLRAAAAWEPRGAQRPAPGAAVRQPPLGYAARIGELRETVKESASSPSCWAEGPRGRGVLSPAPPPPPSALLGPRAGPGCSRRENDLSSRLECMNAASYRWRMPAIENVEQLY